MGRCVLMLLEPTDGAIAFEDRSITHLDKRDWKTLRPQLQMVFQEPYQSLNLRMTAGEAILEPLAVQGWRTDRARREKVVKLIHRVGLDEDYLYRYPHEMSGGEQQRIGIARAIATDCPARFPARSIFRMAVLSQPSVQRHAPHVGRGRLTRYRSAISIWLTAFSSKPELHRDRPLHVSPPDTWCDEAWRAMLLP